MKLDFLIIFVLICFGFLILASALRCWRCSSDASGGAFCSDPFDMNVVNEYQKRWSLVECLSPTGQSSYNNPLNNGGQIQQPNQRPVCKKVKQLGK